MLAWIARFKARRIMVLVMMRWGAMVLVCSEPVMVLGMVMAGVGVDMQRGDLAGDRSQDHSEQDRN